MPHIPGLTFSPRIKDGTFYYECNYVGYKFEFNSPVGEIKEVDYDVNYYDSYDDDGNGIGEEKTMTKKRLAFDNESISQETVSSYFKSTEKSTDGFKEFIAGFFGKTKDDINIFSDDASLKENYNEIDFEQMDDGTHGKIQKSVEQCLGKTIKTSIDGSLVVID